MNPKLSVCIISNIIDDKLHAVVKPFVNTDFEICIGCNGISSNEIETFQIKYPSIRIIELEWKGYGATKNELAQNASSNWILSLDSDEIVDATLLNNILQLALENNQKIYFIKRLQKIGNQQIRYGSYGEAEWKPRLYHKNNAVWNLEKVHEELTFGKQTIIEKLPGTLWHLTANSIEEIKIKNDKYALLSAENMHQRGKKATILKPYLAGIMAFVKQYFFKKGILDGAIGYQLAAEISRYTFQKYKHLIQLQKS